MFLYYRIDLLIIILASDRSLEVLLKASLSAMSNLGLSFHVVCWCCLFHRPDIAPIFTCSRAYHVLFIQ